MSIKPVKIPGVGMRNVKTALAAAFCALAYYFIGRSPAFACIGAIFGMGSDMEDSRKNGGNRLFGTLIGGLLGMLLFCFMIWFMGDMDRVAKCRLWIGLGAILLLGATLVLGTNTYGSTNWIRIGPLSVQPSEFVKIAFIFVGTSTLDRLQTKKNIGEFLIFTGACIGLLALMPDFGMALILFATFLIIAFMRSGSVRTIALVLAGAVLAVFVVLTVKPYVLDRFMGWGHVWEHINDNLGYSQTRTLTYLASGGLFGVGLGNSYLASVFAADSDLVFGLLCEEQGLLLGLVILLAFVLWIFYARSDVTRSRSTFFSIAACAAAGMTCGGAFYTKKTGGFAPCIPM